MNSFMCFPPDCLRYQFSRGQCLLRAVGSPVPSPRTSGEALYSQGKGHCQKEVVGGSWKDRFPGLLVGFFPGWTVLDTVSWSPSGPCPPVQRPLSALSDPIHGSHLRASWQICNEEPDMCIFQSFIYFFFYFQSL